MFVNVKLPNPAGFTVIDVSRLGGKALDLFVLGLNLHHDLYEWCQVEVKTEGGRLTRGEADYINETVQACNGRAPLIMARCTEDVLRWYGLC